MIYWFEMLFQGICMDIANGKEKLLSNILIFLKKFLATVTLAY